MVKFLDENDFGRMKCCREKQTFTIEKRRLLGGAAIAIELERIGISTFDALKVFPALHVDRSIIVACSLVDYPISDLFATDSHVSLTGNWAVKAFRFNAILPHAGPPFPYLP